MDNTIYVALSKQLVLQRELDIAANNMANMNTTGFKFEELMTQVDPASPASTSGISGPVNFVASNGVLRDFTQGALVQTGDPLDLGIEGKGFFQVSTADGPRFTRDGHFKLDSSGRLVTQDGDPVQGDGGDIVLDTTKGPVSISPTGAVSQAGAKVASVSVVTFDSLAALSKAGASLYSNDSNLTPHPSTDALVRQGMLESSNVQPIVQITRLIEINRAYDAVSNMVNSTADLATTAIQQLGSATA